MFNITALILAAGFSMRMKRDKALLKFPNGKTFVEVIIDKLRVCEVKKIYLIRQEKFGKEISGVQNLINKSPEKGMLYSIQLGVKNSFDCEGVMIFPVDMPLVKVETLQILCENAHSDSIIIPKFENKKRGHPIIVGRNFFEDLLNAPLDIGARYVVYQNQEKLKEIVTGDIGVKLNLNTPEIYEKYVIKR